MVQFKNRRYGGWKEFQHEICEHDIKSKSPPDLFIFFRFPVFPDRIIQFFCGHFSNLRFFLNKAGGARKHYNNNNGSFSVGEEIQPKRHTRQWKLRRTSTGLLPFLPFYNKNPENKDEFCGVPMGKHRHVMISKKIRKCGVPSGML